MSPGAVGKMGIGLLRATTGLGGLRNGCGEIDVFGAGAEIMVRKNYRGF